MFSKTNFIIKVGAILFLFVIGISAIEITDVDLRFLDKNGYEYDYRPLMLFAGDGVRMSITVKGEEEGAWVGATVIDPDGGEWDAKRVIEVYCPGLWPIGRSAETVGLAIMMERGMQPSNPTSAISGQTLVISLWEDYVTEAECARRNGGTPCSWCRRNGFHLENRLDYYSVQIPVVGVSLDDMYDY